MQPHQTQTPTKKEKNPRGSGRKLLYGEKTETVGIVVPKSRIKEFFEYCNKIKQKWIEEYNSRPGNNSNSNNQNC